MAKRRAKRKPFDPAVEEAKRERAMAEARSKLRADGIDVAHAEIDGVEVSHAREAEFEAKGVTVVLNHRRRMIRAHKSDIWGELFSRGSLSQEQHTAVRRLQELMARRAGVAGRAEAKSYVDVQIDAPSGACAVSDDMIKAGIEMDLTLRLVGPPSCRLLTALLWPSVMCEPYDWREIVASVGKVSNPAAQPVPLQIAAQALADVQNDVQRELARRADAARDASRARRDRADPQAMALA